MYPTYQKLGKYMEVDFVPYGNADVGIKFIIASEYIWLKFFDFT